MFIRYFEINVRLSIGCSIIAIRTVINALVARGVAQTSWVYHVLVLFQLNFIFESYISLKNGEHTALYQVFFFIVVVGIFLSSF